jgi:hypothetical protein
LKEIDLKVSAFFARNILIFIFLLLPFSTGCAEQPANYPTNITLNTNLADYPGQVVPRYRKFEISFQLGAQYANPFDPDEISVDGYFTSPSSKTLLQPGFYYQNFTVRMAGGTETYSQEGNPLWKIRFSPVEVGTYQYFIRITDKNGTSDSAAGSFTVAASNEKGFLHVSQKNKRYFEFENGAPFIGIGLNVAWWQAESKRISFYSTFLNQMSENRANLARIWMTNSGKNQDWILSIQDQGLGKDYNLEEAWAFDQILNQAQEKDVYFLLTLDDVNQYTYNWNDNVYNHALGGPCPYRSCIFSDSQAMKFQKRIFRYIIARWGYSTSVLSWELFNEIDELQWSDLIHWDWGSVISWHQEMAQYIHMIDSHRHMVNTSTGSFKTHPDLYGLPEMDFAQIHFYYVSGCCDYAPSDPAGQDMADMTRYYAYMVNGSVTDKPSLIGEFGVLGENWTASPLLAADDLGIHLHNGLWASLMSGLATTGLNWHWPDHLAHGQNWWVHYRGIGIYFQDIQTANLSVLKPLNVNFQYPYASDESPDAFSSTNSHFRVMGLRGQNSVYAWVQNTDHTWWNLVNHIAIQAQSGTVTISGFTPGETCSVGWWDTYAAAQPVMKTQVVSVDANGSLQIDINRLSNDVALKIICPP